MGRAQLEGNEEQQEQQVQDDGSRHREPRSPAIIGQVGQSKQQQAQATGNQQEPSQIKRQGWLKKRLMQHTPANHDPDDANGKVDIKNPAPVHICGQIAADHRAKSRGDQDRNAKDAIGKTSLVLRKRSKDEREGQRKERRAPCSLQDTKEDEDRAIPGEATQDRAKGEQREGKQIHAFDAKAIGQKAGSSNDDALSKGIGGGDVGGHMQVSAEGPLNMRQSGVDNGGIQNTDEGAKDGSHQHPPLIVATETSEWASHPCSRHMKMGTHVFFLSPVSLLPSMIAKQER